MKTPKFIKKKIHWERCGGSEEDVIYSKILIL